MKQKKSNQIRIGLLFKNSEDFRKALDIIWEIRKSTREIVQFALPLEENTIIISKKYLSKFKNLKPIQQEVGSMADLSNEEANMLRKKYFWPKE